MPWKIIEEDGEYCVHKEDAEGNAGEKVKCHPTRDEAEAHMAAMYANMPEGEKSVEVEIQEMAVKVGRRHNQTDSQAVQQIHDGAVVLGALCPPSVGEAETYSFPLTEPAMAGKSIDLSDAVLYFGDAVKALGDGKVGGYLVRFGTELDPDLTGEFFTKDTDFGDFQQADVYYRHGYDKKLRKRRLSKGDLRTDDFGVWCEAQLQLRDEYEQFVYKLVEAGKIGWSSGTAPHLVEYEPIGQAKQITKWPLGLDASLELTPAEPRYTNMVIPLKTYLGELQEAGATDGADEPEAGGIPTEEAGGIPVGSDGNPIESDNNNKEMEMELTQEQLDQLVAAAGASGAEAALKALPPIVTANVAVTRDEADVPFAKMGDQLLAVKQATLTQGRELVPRLKALNIKALGANELVGSEGGFLLEPSFVEQLLTPLHESGPFSSRANQLAIGPNANGVIVRAIDETDRATGSRWGGIRGYRLAEAGTKAASQPTFRFVELRLKKYAVLCYATEELLQDSTALAGIIQQGCSEELDFMVNDDILNGAGNAGPLGILVSPALVSVAKESGQQAATLVTQNIFKMWSRMHPRSKTNAVWYINTDVTPQLYQLSLSVGTGGMPMYMAPGALPNAPSGALLGRPVVETEFNASLGTVGDILLADMGQYAMIEKDVQAASSIHVQFLTDQVAYRFVYRCDGQPKWGAPLTPYKGTSNTLSPFVALATRA